MLFPHYDYSLHRVGGRDDVGLLSFVEVDLPGVDVSKVPFRNTVYVVHESPFFSRM
jgi:hypothetical protein